MARILELCDGAEFGDVLWWTAPGAIVASTEQAATGSYSYKAGSEQAASKSWTGNTEMWLRWKTYGTFSAYYDARMVFRSSGNDCFKLQPDDTISRIIYRSGTNVTLGTGSRPYTQNTWHTIELYYKIGASGSIVAKVNGLVDFTYNGDTRWNGCTLIDNLNFVPARYCTWYYDDFAADNSEWCGAGGYILRKPNANGDVNQWLGNDADSTDNYLLVDDVPPDGNTTYVQDDTIGHQDLYHVENYTLPANYYIKGVFSEVRAMDNGGGGAAVKLGCKPSGGSTNLSGSIALPGVYACVKGNYLPTNPVDSQPWEEGDITDLQFAAEVA